MSLRLADLSDKWLRSQNRHNNITNEYWVWFAETDTFMTPSKYMCGDKTSLFQRLRNGRRYSPTGSGNKCMAHARSGLVSINHRLPETILSPAAYSEDATQAPLKPKRMIWWYAVLDGVCWIIHPFRRGFSAETRIRKVRMKSKLRPVLVLGLQPPLPEH